MVQNVSKISRFRCKDAVRDWSYKEILEFQKQIHQIRANVNNVLVIKDNTTNPPTHHETTPPFGALIVANRNSCHKRQNSDTRARPAPSVFTLNGCQLS